jgi:hypothetical protein
MIGMHSFGASAPLKDLLTNDLRRTRCEGREGSTGQVNSYELSDWFGPRRYQLKKALDPSQILGHNVLDIGAFDENLPIIRLRRVCRQSYSRGPC